jgi:hypothetical protein
LTRNSASARASNAFIATGFSAAFINSGDQRFLKGCLALGHKSKPIIRLYCKPLLNCLLSKC